MQFPAALFPLSPKFCLVISGEIFSFFNLLVSHVNKVETVTRLSNVIQQQLADNAFDLISVRRWVLFCFLMNFLCGWLKANNRSFSCFSFFFSDIRSTTLNTHRCSLRFRAAFTSCPTASRRRPAALYAPYCVAIPTRESPAKTFFIIRGLSRTMSTVRSSTPKATPRRPTISVYLSGTPTTSAMLRCRAKAAVSTTWCRSFDSQFAYASSWR